MYAFFALTVSPSSGRSKTQAAAPHEQLKAQMEEWGRKLQNIDASGGAAQDAGQAASSRDKEDAMGEIARAFEKLLHMYGQNA